MAAEPEDKELRPKSEQEKARKTDENRSLNRPRNEPTQPKEISGRREEGSKSFGTEKTNTQKGERNS